MRIAIDYLLDQLDIEDKSPDKIKEALVQLGFECELDGDILDVQILANRGDCLCVEGLLRELCAYYNKKFIYSQPQLHQEEGIEAKVQILAKDVCPLYTARVIGDVIIEPSPQWLQKILTSADIHPINNIVDIANFVMLMQGNPVHAFDYHKIKGEVKVRYARSGECMVTLDGKCVELSDDILVIADDVGVMAIAGIIGSADYAISEDTTALLIEAAVFDAVMVRFGMKKLGIITQAGYRFERHVNAANLVRVQNTTAALIKQFIPCAKVYKLITQGSMELKEPMIICESGYFEKVLGHKLDFWEICDYLNRLMFEVKTVQGKLHVTVPYHRIHDVKRPADLVEEVLRLHGCKSISPQLPHPPPITHKKLTQLKNLRHIREYLRNKCLHEVITYSFIPKDAQDVFDHNYLQLKNPLPLNLNTLRTSLLPGLLSTASTNLRHGREDLGLFEIGRIFLVEDSKIVESLYLGIVCVGKWFFLCGARSINFDFYVLSGILSGLFNELRIEFRIERKEVAWLHPGKSAGIFSEDKCFATFGQIHPQLAKTYKLPTNMVLGEVCLDNLLSCEKKHYEFSPIPKYPTVKRDISLIVKAEVECAKIIKIIKKAGGCFVESVELFDYYVGEQIPAGYKSLSYSITLRSQDKVFTTSEIDSILFYIISTLEEEVNAKLRK